MNTVPLCNQHPQPAEVSPSVLSDERADTVYGRGVFNEVSLMVLIANSALHSGVNITPVGSHNVRSPCPIVSGGEGIGTPVLEGGTKRDNPVCSHLHTCACACVCVCARIRVRVRVRARVHVRVRVCVCVCVFVNNHHIYS